MQNNYGLEIIDENGFSIFNPDTMPFIFHKKITFKSEEFNKEIVDTGLNYKTNTIYFIGCNDVFTGGGAQVDTRKLNNGNSGIAIRTGLHEVDFPAVFPRQFFVYVFYQDSKLLEQMPDFGLAIFDQNGRPIYHSGKKILKAQYVDRESVVQIKQGHATLSSVINISSYLTMQLIPNRLVYASFFQAYNVWILKNGKAALMPARIIVDIHPATGGGSISAKVTGNVSTGAFIIDMNDYD